jgi:hypothetical protein
VNGDLHTLTLVGIREDRSTHTFYRWAFTTTAAQLAVVAFSEAVDEAGLATGFKLWRLECACKWTSVEAQKPIELAGLGFIHLLTARIQ